MKIVINDCFGGFGLSNAAYEKLIEYGCPVRRYLDSYGKVCFSGKIDIENKRSNALLVSVIEELGSDKASGPYSRLKIIKIPDDVEWEIVEWEGAEHVAEKHRTWR